MDGDDAHRIIDSDEGFQLLLIFFEAFGILLRINLSAGDILGNVAWPCCSAARCGSRLRFSVTNAKGGLQLHSRKLVESAGQGRSNRSQASSRRQSHGLYERRA
jgi:hypothetical protein